MTYGWAKLTGEYLGRLAHERYGLRSVVYRPFSGFAEVPHTADIALDVFAPNLEELFINAAKGLYHILGIRKGTKEVENIHISMVAEDREVLMVSLLNELLFHAANNQAGEFD